MSKIARFVGTRKVRMAASTATVPEVVLLCSETSYRYASTSVRYEKPKPSGFAQNPIVHAILNFDPFFVCALCFCFHLRYKYSYYVRSLWVMGPSDARVSVMDSERLLNLN